MSESISWRFIAVLVFLAAIAFTTPFIVQAVGQEADAMCLPDANPDPCTCGPKFDPEKKTCSGLPTKYKCFCKDTTNTGITSGYCDATFHCKGTAFSSAAGQPGGATGMDQLMQALKGIMDALKGGGGGSPPPSSQPPTGTGSEGCKSSYYQTSDQAKSTTDPCAYYVPGGSTDSSLSSYGNLFPTSGGTDSGSLFNYYNSQPSLQGLSQPTNSNTNNTQTGLSNISTSNGTETSATNQLLRNLNGSSTTFGNFNTPVTSSGGNSADNSNTSTSGASLNESTVNPGTISGLTDIIMMQLLGGARGNIELTPEGATIYAANRDERSNTEISGFYGSNTMGTQPTGIVARLCTNRPWASGTFASIIPPSFFDSLCKWQGYQVGTPTIPPVTTQTSTGGSAQGNTTFIGQSGVATTTALPIPPSPPPQVDIWAVPTTVSLGARTAIFWNSRNVSECLVISPDGNFHETRLSGGAATVPITTATTFTISCSAQGGQHAEAYVIVRLKI
ncbi:MAG: hypothetical protein UY70_C0024G0008 [Candidatus Kaiserbacteria bacterium GW2011_GWB1_52_6]|uniref:Uncharacterized protein n=2 Tax=Candidatus Kaiseribacteriota TaxID=1752734 RepID=A0A0G1ZF00_9BACT|nr:MAG: hypothetical protein UY67_C0003G0010 [Candidatus Kaiserbacteria bacterium GW2011_GWA2_52_12]KKW26442.1 MAG: hypothetical protein UY70_C0024G0008 [Candidatus Kaiserbacteria bacterium GW2011_GWB1_52_6]